MKNILLTVTAILFGMNVFSQRDVTGTWLGTLDIGTKLRIVFHFNKNPAGKFIGTCDSPDQNVKGIPCTVVNMIDDSIFVELKQMNAKISGKKINDSSIAGIFTQGGARLPLFLSRVKQVAALNRPQTPVAPFSYQSEDVEYDNVNKSVHFGATFTYPETGNHFTTIVLITGSGQQDRDETIFEHKPFAVVADYLTKKGYAVLRVDDRGIGKTSGAVVTATTADFADDVKAGISYLLTRPEVNKKKIGLYGHTEGGLIAPMVAAGNKNVSFVILSGSPMTGGLEINVAQNGYALQKAGISAAAIDAFKELHREELQNFKSSTSVIALNTRVLAVFDSWRKEQPQDILDQLYVNDKAVAGQNILSMYDGLYNNNWMKFFIGHDFTADLSRVRCNVLAINGEKDSQVDAKTNLTLIKSTLEKSGNKSFTIVALPGLNHLLQHADTGDSSEYGTIEETIAVQALDIIGGWLDKNVKNRE